MLRFLLFITLFPLFAFAADGDFIYSDARLKVAPPEMTITWDKHFLSKQYYPLEKSGQGLPSIGLNQLFLSRNNDSFISIKWDIEGNTPINRWLDIEGGHLIHLNYNEKVIGFYFFGVSELDAKSLLNGLAQKFPKKTTSYFDIAISPAHAGSACAPTLESNNIERSEAARTMNSAGAATVSSMLSNCFKGMKDGASETVTGWGDSIRSATNWVGGELKGWWNNPRKKASQYYDGVKKAVVGVKNFIVMIGEVLINPAKGTQMLKKSLGEAGEWFGEIFASLSALPLEQKVEMTCSLVAGLGTDFILGALSGAAIAGTVLTLVRVAKSLKKLAKVFNMVKKMGSDGFSRLGLDANTRAKLFRGIKSGKLDDKKLALLDDVEVVTSPVAREMALKGVTCAL